LNHLGEPRLIIYRWTGRQVCAGPEADTFLSLRALEHTLSLVWGLGKIR
jgi:hypothetical protein